MTALPTHVEDEKERSGGTVGAPEVAIGNEVWPMDTGTAAAFVSPFSLDVTAEQQRYREEAQRNAPWSDITTGPASMVISTTSGTTDSFNLPPPSTPPYIQEDPPTHGAGARSDTNFDWLEGNPYST